MDDGFLMCACKSNDVSCTKKNSSFFNVRKNEKGNSKWYKEENLCNLPPFIIILVNGKFMINHDYINLKGLSKFFLQLKITPIKYQGIMIVVEKYSSFFTTWYFLYM